MAASYCVGKEELMCLASSVIIFICQIRINLVRSVDRIRSAVTIKASLDAVAFHVRLVKF